MKRPPELVAVRALDADGRFVLGTLAIGTVSRRGGRNHVDVGEVSFPTWHGGEIEIVTLEVHWSGGITELSVQEMTEL